MLRDREPARYASQREGYYDRRLSEIGYYDTPLGDRLLQPAVQPRTKLYGLTLSFVNFSLIGSLSRQPDPFLVRVWFTLVTNLESRLRSGNR